VSEAEIQYIQPALVAIAHSSHYQREWQFRRKDGSLLPADVIAAVIDTIGKAMKSGRGRRRAADRYADSRASTACRRRDSAGR